MMPPNNETIKNINGETGVSEQSLYKWQQKARLEGNPTLEMDKLLNAGVAKTNF